MDKLVGFFTGTSWLKYAGIGLAALLGTVFILGALRSCDKRHEQDNSNLVNQGTLIEQSHQQQETINAIQTSQQVTQHPTTEQLNIVCSKYDRNCPGNHP